MKTEFKKNKSIIYLDRIVFKIIYNGDGIQETSEQFFSTISGLKGIIDYIIRNVKIFLFFSYKNETSDSDKVK